MPVNSNGENATKFFCSALLYRLFVFFRLLMCKMLKDFVLIVTFLNSASTPTYLFKMLVRVSPRRKLGNSCAGALSSAPSSRSIAP